MVLKQRKSLEKGLLPCRHTPLRMYLAPMAVHGRDDVADGEGAEVSGPLRLDHVDAERS